MHGLQGFHRLIETHFRDFLSFITILSGISILISLFMIYLSVNKIWVRKHDLDVSDSISLFAYTMSIIQATITLILALNALSVKGIFMGCVSFAVTVLYILIAIGYWVNNDLTLKQKIFRAYKMDRAESGAMIKDLLNVANIETVFKIIAKIALADRELQRKEIILLKEFAKHNNIDYEKIINQVKSEVDQDDAVVIMSKLKKDIENYMKTSPPKSVVIWFQDLVEKLINIDGVVTDTESVMLAEIKGLMHSYLFAGDKKVEKFYLILLPQSKEDEVELLSIRTEIEKSQNSIFGSKVAYILDSFYSKKLAEVTRDSYLKLFNCAIAIEQF